MKIKLKLLASLAVALNLFAGGASSGGGGGGVSVNPPRPAIPDSLPLASDDTLTAFALAIVSEIDGGVSGQSVFGQATFQVPYLYRDADPDHMAVIARSQIIYPEADPSDTLSASLEYRGNIPGYNFICFSGSRNFTLEPGKAGWQAPADAFKIGMKVNQRIPITLSGVNRVWRVTTETGQPRYYSYNADGKVNKEWGYFTVGPDDVNHTGTLYAELTNGTIVDYDLKTGKRKHSYQFTGNGFEAVIPGVRSVNNTALIVYQPGDSIIRAGFDRSTHVNVLFLPGIAIPSEVFVIDAGLLAENPLAEWESFNPFGPTTVQFDVGKGVILIRFGPIVIPVTTPVPLPGVDPAPTPVTPGPPQG